MEARPWAEVYVDNQFRDSTPLGKPILLSPGKHFLELKHPQLSSYREFINIASGDTLRLQIALKVN
ncbi:MAG: PEGA domain-containing protein [Gammaproteobacteria bacterium]|nr:PEGA domain-containing protein [Gammaproteobacteria bacterium]